MALLCFALPRLGLTMSCHNSSAAACWSPERGSTVAFFPPLFFFSFFLTTGAHRNRSCTSTQKSQLTKTTREGFTGIPAGFDPHPAHKTRSVQESRREEEWQEKVHGVVCVILLLHCRSSIFYSRVFSFFFPSHLLLLLSFLSFLFFTALFRWSCRSTWIIAKLGGLYGMFCTTT